MAYTKGPWYLLKTDGADFTSISKKDKLPLSDWNTDKQGNPVEETIDDENEVLGTSEWLRAKPEDLKLMAAAPELYEALKELFEAQNIDAAVKATNLLSRLKGIEE